eukprot:g10991.t1
MSSSLAASSGQHAAAAQRIREAVQEHGPAPGAQTLLRAEFRAAKRATELGVYGVWRPRSEFLSLSPARCSRAPGEPEFCARVGLHSRCFCGHAYADHADCQAGIAAQSKERSRTVRAQPPPNSACTVEGCGCDRFRFMPQRPEEVGEWWLVRRRGFDVRTWRAKCKLCKKTHEEHEPRSEACNVYGGGRSTTTLRSTSALRSGPRFESAWCCVVCELPYEKHETVWETEQERLAENLVVGREFFPLVQDPGLQALVLKGDAGQSSLPFREGVPERSVRLSGHGGKEQGSSSSAAVGRRVAGGAVGSGGGGPADTFAAFCRAAGSKALREQESGKGLGRDEGFRHDRTGTRSHVSQRMVGVAQGTSQNFVDTGWGSLEDAFPSRVNNTVRRS